MGRFDCTKFKAKYVQGEGAEGKIVTLENDDTRQIVAAKVIKCNSIDFNRDRVKLLQKIKHESIITFYDFEITEFERIEYMEFIDGTTLYCVIQKSGMLNLLRAFPIYYKILKAVEYLHSINVAHMDIKLDNILIQKSWQPKLIDFGHSVDHELVTSIGRPLGTYVYAAPEVNTSKHYSGFPCDVWSLHITLLAMLRGSGIWSKAIEKDSQYDIWMQGNHSIDKKLKEFTNLNTRQFLSRMLVHNPNERPTIIDVKRDPWFIQMSVYCNLS